MSVHIHGPHVITAYDPNEERQPAGLVFPSSAIGLLREKELLQLSHLMPGRHIANITVRDRGMPTAVSQ